MDIKVLNLDDFDINDFSKEDTIDISLMDEDISVFYSYPYYSHNDVDYQFRFSFNDNNVCFLEIGEKYENIKVSCDWCSICNGIMETAKQNIIADPKLLKEVKGQAISDYQGVLEEAWIASLKEKYPIVIHEELLQNIVQ